MSEVNRLDKDLMTKRIDATEIACNVAISYENPLAMDAEVTLPARRILELVELARIGLEHA